MNRFTVNDCPTKPYEFTASPIDKIAPTCKHEQAAKIKIETLKSEIEELKEEIGFLKDIMKHKLACTFVEPYVNIEELKQRNSNEKKH